MCLFIARTACDNEESGRTGTVSTHAGLKIKQAAAFARGANTIPDSQLSSFEDLLGLRWFGLDPRPLLVALELFLMPFESCTFPV